MLTLSLSPAALPARAQQQVQNALRQADQAERTAKSLSQQAEAAQRSAEREQNRADRLSTQASAAHQESRHSRSSAQALQAEGARPQAALQAQPLALGQLLDAYV